MFFDTVPSLLGFAIYIHHFCSSSLEFFVLVHRFASFLLFFLQIYLLTMYHLALHDLSTFLDILSIRQIVIYLRPNGWTYGDETWNGNTSGKVACS